jgi:hypothetical protein
MAKKVKISISSANSKKKKKSGGRKAKSKLDLELPMDVSILSENISDFSMLVHGEKKIGKTSLFAQEENNFFLEFDPEQKALEILQAQCPDWDHLLGYLDLLEAEGKRKRPRYDTVTVDGADIMYKQCFAWTCKRLGINHPSDLNDYGDSWNQIRVNFQDAVVRLLNLPMTPRFICHSKWKEIKTRGGGKVDKLVPLLTSQAEEVLVGLIDIWAAYVYDDDQRVLVIKGDEAIGAGHRVDHKFRTPFDNQMIEEISMGSSPREAYDNLLVAWDGRQTYISIEDRDKKAEKGAKKKTKKKLVKKAVVKVKRKLKIKKKR